MGEVKRGRVPVWNAVISPIYGPREYASAASRQRMLMRGDGGGVRALASSKQSTMLEIVSSSLGIISIGQAIAVARGANPNKCSVCASAGSSSG